MAIGNTGGSAASRFRPRGTAPIAGLGRRNLLAEDGEQAEAEEVTETPQQENVVSTQEQQMRTFVRRGQNAQAAADAVIEDHARQTPSATAEVVESLSSTATAQSPLTTGTTAAPRRGRRASSTKLDSTPNSVSDTEGRASSVSAARARMRDIEAQAKAMKANYANDLAALQKDYKLRTTELQTEYQQLSQMILDSTFGF